MGSGKVKACATGWIDKAHGIVVDGTQYPQTGIGIQAAIDAVPSTGGMVLITPGTYLVTTRLLLPSNVTVVGAGAGLTILKQPDSTNLSVVVRTNGSNITIRDLTIDGNSDNNASVDTIGYHIQFGTDHRIQNVEVKNCRGQAIYVASSATVSTKRVWIEDCYLHDIDPSAVGNETIRIDTNVATTIEDVFIQNNRMETNSGGQHIGVVGTTSDTDPMKRIVINGNTIQGALASAFMQIQLSNDIVVSNNNCATGAGGIFFVGTTAAGDFMNRSVCIGNTIQVITGLNNGIEQSGGGGSVSFSGNTVTGVQNSGKFGISAGTAKAVSVHGNSVYACTGGGIQLRADTAATNNGPFACVGNTIVDCTGSPGISAATNVPSCVISNNSITNANRGILVTDNSSGALVGMTISGNSINTVTNQGIYVQGRQSVATNATRMSVFGNNIWHAGLSGILLGDVSESIISGNFVSSCSGSGIKFQATSAGTSDNISLFGNMCYDNGLSNADGDDGVVFAATDHNQIAIIGNMCFDSRASAAGATQDMGIIISNAAYNDVIIQGNFARQNKTADIRTTNTTNIIRGADATDNNRSVND